MILYLISLFGEVVLSNCDINGFERDFIYWCYVWRYIFQKLESMYQKRFLTNVDGIMDNICDMQFLIHNITQKKLKYICSYCYLMTYSLIGFLVDFVNKNWTEIFIYFWKYLLETVSFCKEIFLHILKLFMIHISVESSLVNHSWLYTFFSFLINQTIRFKYVQLKRKQKIWI